jgi:phospholipase C
MGEGPATVHARYRKARRYAAIGAATIMGAGLAVGTTVGGANAAPRTVSQTQTSSASSWITSGTATPIKHLVVIFQENVSFDHYFGTYPFAANTDGTTFQAKKGTKPVNGLYKKITKSGPVGPLLTNNPNLFNPMRLTHSQALTCDQNHGYTAEQNAVNGGMMNKFIQFTNTPTCTGTPTTPYGAPGLVMNYFDGNTVTGLWNYAQNYAMSDNNWDTVFGPSTPGALNLISGQTGGSYAVNPITGVKVTTPIPGAVSGLNSDGLGTIYGDPDPAFDDCSDGSHASTNPVAVATGKNVGDLLNAKGVTWGWFQGGFTPTGTNAAGYAVCGSTSKNVGGNTVTDYSPHHEPFQYYKSTSNPKHLPPSSEAMIGRTDRANHQYDISNFYATLTAGNMPAVSFLKAPAAQDGHAGYSSPLDEQTFLVNTINQIEQSKDWKSTAIVVTYDDSDGWYDHQPPVIVNGSNTSGDTAICSSAPMKLDSFTYRCGYSQRLPLVVISPYTRSNFVSSRLTNTSSITRFIEDNWVGGQRIAGSFDAISGNLFGPRGVLNFNKKPNFQPVILDPTTGAVVSS